MIPLGLVLDTNILVSAALKPDGLQRTVFVLAITKPARLYVTEAILAEYREVLSRRELEIRRGLREQLLQLVRNHISLSQRTRSRSRRTLATTSFRSAPMLPVPTTW